MSGMPLGLDEAREHQREEGRDVDVDEDAPRHEDDARCGGDDERGQHASCGRTQRPADEEGRDDDGHGAGGDTDALDGDGDAEQVVEAGDDPVTQDRLIEARHPVEPGVEIVAPENHLPGRLDVERLVRVPDGVGAQRDEEHRDGEGEERIETRGTEVFSTETACSVPEVWPWPRPTSGTERPVSVENTSVPLVLMTEKCRRPVKTIAMPCSSAAAMTSASRTDPPGWTTAVAPAAATASSPSRNGKNASEAATDR